jgi:hypothetical protein
MGLRLEGSPLHEHGGRSYQLVDVTYLGETTKYATFEVRRATQLGVRNQEGARRDLRLFGSTLIVRGRYKVFSYVVD